MKKTRIGTTSIYIEAIEPCPADERGSRRRRETAAVCRIARALGIEIGHDPDGAPITEGAYVSVSHSQGLAVVAIDTCRPVGIDAEDWRQALWRVRPKFLTAAETELFADPDALLRAWTAKEAVYKALPAPRAQMTEIECDPTLTSATALGCRYALASWLEGATRITLAYPHHDAADQR